MSKNNKRIYEENGINFSDITYELCMNNAEFVDAISGTTKSIAAVRTRYSIWRSAIELRVGKIEMAELP